MTAERASRHHRHLIELASILATAGLADVFADVFNMHRHGAGALIGIGSALVVGTVGHHIWLRRTDHAPPHAPKPAAFFAAAAPLPAGAVLSGDEDAVPAAVWRVRTEIDNAPGRLAVFAGALAAAGANILALEAHPTGGGVVDEFLVEASPHTTAEQLCAAVRAVGGRAAHAASADVLALIDAPTRALELAGRLVRRAASPASVLADLLDAHSVLIDEADRDATNNRPDMPAEDESDRGAGLDGGGLDGGGYGLDTDRTTLRLRRPDGTVVTATRPEMPFTATELARAKALLDLEACLRTDLDPAS